MRHLTEKEGVSTSTESLENHGFLNDQFWDKASEKEGKWDQLVEWELVMWDWR